MTFANLTTDPGTDRNSFSCIGVTIADAIDDSKREFPNCYQTPKIAGMTEISDPRVEILKAIVEAAGGPADFARRYSRDDADKPIDATYVSQIINGHRPFRDKARLNMARRAGLADDYFESKAKPDCARRTVIPHRARLSESRDMTNVILLSSWKDRNLSDFL